MSRFKLGKFKATINGISVLFYEKEVHQWKAGQKHLPTYCRDTYTSSRWVEALPQNAEFKSFKVKVKGTDYEKALDTAIEKVKKLTQ